MRLPSRRNAMLVAIALLALLFSAPLWVHPYTWLNAVQTARWPDRFSATEWRAHPRQRWRMANDLANGTQLRGLTETQTVALLGRPDSSAQDAIGEKYDGVLRWQTPAPQRPADYLAVFLTNGRVLGWSVTTDEMMGPQAY